MSRCLRCVVSLRSWWRLTPHGKIEGTWQAGLLAALDGHNVQGLYVSFLGADRGLLS